MDHPDKLLALTLVLLVVDYVFPLLPLQLQLPLLDAELVLSEEIAALLELHQDRIQPLGFVVDVVHVHEVEQPHHLVHESQHLIHKVEGDKIQDDDECEKRVNEEVPLTNLFLVGVHGFSEHRFRDFVENGHEDHVVDVLEGVVRVDSEPRDGKLVRINIELVLLVEGFQEDTKGRP